MRRFSTATASLVFGAIFVASLHAQLTVTVEDADVFRQLRRTGDTLTFDSEGVRQAVEERLVISYEGDFGTAEIEEPEMVGSSTFLVSSAQSFPVILDPGETHVILVRFVPTGVGPFTGQLRLPIKINLRGSDNSFLFNLSGRVADYSLSFQLPGGNQTVVGNGGTVSFEDTTVDTTMAATVIATNRGSGPGTLETVSIAGGGIFELGGLGLLPATIPPERDFRFQVRFTPTAAQSFGGSLRLGFGAGASTLQLAGNGVAAAYSYRLTTSDGQTASIPENGTVSVGSTPVGEEIAATLTVTNAGTAEGRIGNITITGDGYSLSDRPQLPALLEVGESFTITINLTPVEPGPATGQLRIGDSTFDLSGEGLDTILTYTLTTSDGQTASIPENGTISVGSTPVGEEIAATLTVTNAGTAEGRIGNITITGDGYSLSNRPLLPALLEVGESFTITINLTPVEPGPATGQLRIGDSTFDLSGEGLDTILTYTLTTSDGQTASIPENGTISVGSTPVGEEIAATLTVTNAGTAEGRIGNITITGGGYSLSDRPLLPALLEVGESFTITINLTPVEPGPATGQLRIGDSTFDLSGEGLDTILTYTLTTSDGLTASIPENGTISVGSTPVGEEIAATLTVTNAGTAEGRIGNITITGGGYSLSNRPLLPALLEVGESFTITINLTPVEPGPATGQLRIGDSTFDLSGEGLDTILTYTLTTSDGLTASIPENGTISVGSTPVGEEIAATLTVTNAGTAEGRIGNITITGGGYSLSNRPLLPALLEVGESFTITINLTPVEPGPATGQLRIGDSTFDLSGEGLDTILTYTLTTSDGLTASIPENGTISVGSTPVGEEIAATLTVANAGTAEGRIGNITITGGGYSLSDRPLLPALLEVGESFTITINLTPVEPGPATGQLRIGDSTFDLSGEGLGAILTYTLVDADGSKQIEPRDTIVFPQTQVGGASEVTLQISNSGNESETLSGIGVGAGAFSLRNLPELPSPLQADQTITFAIVFEPERLGPQSAMLAVNAANFTLSGVGENVPDLPAVSFSTSGGTVAAADSVPISLSIAEVFPVDIKGVLRLTFDTEAFSNAPTIQFSTGGRNASFRIPKGRTEAIFPGNLTTNPFLTGTVAGTITASATFATEAGSVDITPDTIPEVVFTVTKAAPLLRSMTLGSTGQGRFSVLVTGFATSRTVSQLQIAFAGVTGADITTPNLTADVADAFTLYYGSNQSANFGSLFTATVAFTVNEGEFEDLSTVTITAANELGQSNPVSLTLN